MDWQVIVTLLIIAAAAVYVGRTFWRIWTAQGTHCGGGCTGCPSQQSTAQLVSLDLTLSTQDTPTKP